jgi:hypothetical protein
MRTSNPNRCSVLNQVKDVCHIWELGGGALHPTLLSAPLAAGSNDLRHLTVILMLDLAAPQQLWLTLETLIQNLHVALRKQASALSGKDAGQFIQQLQEEAWIRVGKENEVQAVNVNPLGRNTVWTYRYIPIFQRNKLPQSSALKDLYLIRVLWSFIIFTIHQILG